MSRVSIVLGEARSCRRYMAPLLGHSVSPSNLHGEPRSAGRVKDSTPLRGVARSHHKRACAWGILLQPSLETQFNCDMALQFWFCRSLYLLIPPPSSLLDSIPDLVKPNYQSTPCWLLSSWMFLGRNHATFWFSNRNFPNFVPSSPHATLLPVSGLWMWQPPKHLHGCFHHSYFSSNHSSQRPSRNTLVKKISSASL